MDEKTRPFLEVDILSLFPTYFQSPFSESILKRALEKEILRVHCVNIRDFAEGKHQRVDDRPYGGGPGMVLMPGPCVKAIRSVKRSDSHVVFFTPRGEQLTAATCERLSKKSHLILLCGHYEGVDERVMKSIDESLSIGPYVLTSGCLPAIVLIDAVARFLPGVLGHPEGAYLDSFQEGKLEGPQYTRPEEFEGEVVPEVLRGGNHQEIAKWREEQRVITGA